MIKESIGLALELVDGSCPEVWVFRVVVDSLVV